MNENVSDKVAKQGRSLKSEGKWMANQARDTAEEYGSEISNKARQVYDNVKSASANAFSRLRSGSFDMAREYPIQTAFATLAAGFILGAAISRARK